MTLERIIAELLGYPNKNRVRFEKNDQISGLLDGLNEFIIETDHDNFLVQVVEESDFEPENNVLDQRCLAHLAGFYNARYLYEMVKFESINIPVGRFHKYVKPISFKSKDYAATIVQLPRHFSAYFSRKINSHQEEYVKKREIELNLNQLFSVAQKLCILHESCLPERRKKEVKEIIEENYQLISDITFQRLQQKVNDYLDIVLEKNNQFFKNTDVTFEKFSTLFKTIKDLQECYPESNLPTVLCHGNLGPQNLIFNEKDEVEFIDHWESLHFGSAAEDLSFLIVTSLPPNIRRNNYMRIFRRYYYTLVDTRSIKFKLSDLKNFYLKFLKFSVFHSFPTLAGILESHEYTDEEKFRAVNRWEAALDDAFDVEMDNYMSDNEDLLTLQNSEDRSVTEAVLRTRHSTDSILP
ncbi:hypothetical protein FO519_005774 [Halicephalobus sp. NKZ332]|nr:hypothetical protein FO519_005774 [Halicephalobus sp. NKZ332]